MILRILVPLICALSLLSGCSVYQITGDTMVNYSSEHMIPYLLERDDTEAVCATGLGLGGFLMSFGRVTDAPHKASTTVMLSASTCSELQAWQAELRYTQAMKRGDAITARDERIIQMKAHRVTASRLYQAYQSAKMAFREPGGDCPELENEADQFVWLLGMLSAIQGTQHDRAARGVVGIPLDLPLKAARGAQCLDNARWWGVPQALQAAVWTSIPGSAPEGVDPWRDLESAVKIGDESGVRLARAIQMKAFVGSGKSDEVRKALVAYQESNIKIKRNLKWKTLDRMGQLQIQHVSDLLWIKERGHRTPFNELGALPDTPEADDSEDDEDDLLDDMDGGE
jgi:hypothetical protein